MNQIIDTMPTLGEVESADQLQIVRWYLFLRPTMSNDELVIVKAIAARFERMPESSRSALIARARRGT